MKRLTCEMCGSTDMLKQDGVFVCQTCGTKYSVEEAKKMMIEGTVNVSGTVKVDNTDKIKNYIEMAKSAYDADNKSEAESYCNRILEIEPENYEAWFLKGKAAGWQSTLANIRIEESVQCFSKAIDYAPEEKVSYIKNNAAKEVSLLSTAMVSLTCNNFANYPNSDNASNIINYAAKSKIFALTLLAKCGIKPFEYEETVATLINNGAMEAWNHYIVPNFTNDNDGYPSEYALDRLVNQAGYCEGLIKLAISFSDNDEENDVNRYYNLIEINRYCINAKSYKKEYTSYGSFWTPDKCLNKNAIERRENDNAHYQRKIAECKEIVKKKRREALEKKKEDDERKKKEQKERNEAYWAEHVEEKQQLESERDTLQAQLKQLREQINPYNKEITEWKKKRESETPAKREKNRLQKQMYDLGNEKKNLGIFKGSAKRELQSLIDEISSRIPAINESIEAEEKEQLKLCNDKISEIEQQAKPIKEKIDIAEKRINEIRTELNKDR